LARHFYYVLLMNMFLNIILNVPNILLNNRFHGAIMAMILSIPIGTLLTFLFMKAMGKFAKQGLPEIFEQHLPKWIRMPYLIFLGVMWAISGIFALISYSYIIKIYLNPEIKLYIILGFFIAIVIYGATLRSRSILYLTEIIIITAFPIVFYILFKTLTSQFLYPVHALRILHFTWQLPSYSSIAAATYIFIGYVNLAIFNRNIQTAKALKFIWILPILALFMLISSFFIPIGFFGIHGVGNTVFPWILTSDSLRTSFGFIERTIYYLLLMYLQLTLLFGIVTWHIAIKLIFGAFTEKKNKGGKKREYLTLLLLIGFGLLAIFLEETFNQRELFSLVQLWFNFRLPIEAMLVGLVFFFSLRRQKG
jgi:hypothetical protein